MYKTDNNVENSVVYVISVKRIRDGSGKPLIAREQIFDYICFDEYTDVPTMSSLGDALSFTSVPEALNWWSKYKSIILKREGNRYDWDSLAVRKFTLTVKVEKATAITV